MLLGKVRRGFFQELVLDLDITVLPLKLTQPRPLSYRQVRLITSMLPLVLIDPIPQGLLDDPQLTRNMRDRPRRVDDQLHRLSLKLSRIIPPSHHFPTSSQVNPILWG